MGVGKGSNTFLTKCRMYLSIFLSMALMIIQGITSSWTSPMLKKLNHTDDNPLGAPISVGQSSLLGSIRIPGMVIGAILFGMLAKLFGRKIMLLVLCAPSLIFFLTMAFAKVFWLMAVAKFIEGVERGGLMIVLPMYIAELAEPKVRGKLCACLAICKNIGIVITYSLGPTLSFYWFHLGLSLIPLSFLILFTIFGLESPYHLLLHNDTDMAVQIVRQLRGKNDVTKEIEEMKRGVRMSEGSFFDIFKSRATRRALVIGTGMAVFIILTGDTVIMTYTQYIFDEVGDSNWAPETNTLIVGVSQLVITLLSFILTDKFARKPQLIVSYGAVTISLGLLGFYFYLQRIGVNTSNLGLMPLFAMIGYMVAVYLGIEPLMLSIKGEIYPLKVRSSAIAFSLICGSCTGFIMNMSFQRVRRIIGMDFTIWILSGFGICAVIFMIFFMIETRGKTLEEVQDELQCDKKKHRIRNRIA